MRRLPACDQASSLASGKTPRIVDEDALVHALGDGTIARAALDVFDVEPLTGGPPLDALPQRDPGVSHRVPPKQPFDEFLSHANLVFRVALLKKI